MFIKNISLTNPYRFIKSARAARAQSYAKTLSSDEVLHLSQKQQKRLEGLQYGLKSFEGLTFKEIYFLISKPDALFVPVYRDCAGRCAACYVNGRPKRHDIADRLERMDFDDFKNFTNDLKELNKRLKFNLRNKFLQNNFNKTSAKEEPVSALFYDSDCKDIWLQDKDGRVHEFSELNKMLHEATGIKGLFDTAGWSPRNTGVQQRVERMVDYYTASNHADEIDEINVSLNTYHGLLVKANQFKAKGDMEGYKRLRYQYVKNMANAIYTMTPFLNSPLEVKKKYVVLVKCVNSSTPAAFNDYKSDTLQKIIDEIFVELEKKYCDDLKSGVKKYVQSEENIPKLLKAHRERFSNVITWLSPNPANELFSKLPQADYALVKNRKASFKDVLEAAHAVFINMNGKVYLSNDSEVFATDLQLNFKNKNKKTKMIFPIPDVRRVHVKDKSFY